MSVEYININNQMYTFYFTTIKSIINIKLNFIIYQMFQFNNLYIMLFFKLTILSVRISKEPFIQ